MTAHKYVACRNDGEGYRAKCACGWQSKGRVNKITSMRLLLRHLDVARAVEQKKLAHKRAKNFKKVSR